MPDHLEAVLTELKEHVLPQIVADEEHELWIPEERQDLIRSQVLECCRNTVGLMQESALYDLATERLCIVGESVDDAQLAYRISQLSLRHHRALEFIVGCIASWLDAIGAEYEAMVQGTSPADIGILAGTFGTHIMRPAIRSSVSRIA